MTTATMADVTSSHVPPHAAEWEKTNSVCLTAESKRFQDSHLNLEISADILIKWGKKPTKEGGAQFCQFHLPNPHAARSAF